MKKRYLVLPIMAVFALVLISWGVTGHRTVALIAEKHLTPKAAAAVKDLLGTETMAGVSTYADRIRSQDEYKYTGPWHYINMTSGLNEHDFYAAVKSQEKDNVYKALLKCKADLADPSKTRDEKIFALKFIIHLVGDLHQPMHVSRAEDQGGNKIQVTFLGNPGNLHGLWDSGLPEHEGLTDVQLAAKVDKATPEQINTWQHEDVLKWLYESYQVSEQLYADAAKNPAFDEAYYQAHIPVFEDRLEKGGIRLAGVLNAIFQ